MPVLCVALSVPGKEVCYERLGCFSNEKPWAGMVQRPLKILPWSPEDIDTRFLLFTNENPDNYQVSVGMGCLGWVTEPVWTTYQGPSVAG